MSEKFKVEVVTPTGVVLDKEVEESNRTGDYGRVRSSDRAHAHADLY